MPQSLSTGLSSGRHKARRSSFFQSRSHTEMKSQTLPHPTLCLTEGSFQMSLWFLTTVSLSVPNNTNHNTRSTQKPTSSASVLFFRIKVDPFVPVQASFSFSLRVSWASVSEVGVFIVFVVGSKTSKHRGYWRCVILGYREWTMTILIRPEHRASQDGGYEATVGSRIIFGKEDTGESIHLSE